MSQRRKSRPMVQPPGTFEYIVQENDTLRGLAAKFEVKLSLLKSANKLMSDVIFPEQVLFIPNEPALLRPGHSERLSKSLDEGYMIPPRPLSSEEVAKIDEECHHKFVKLMAELLTEDQETRIPGILLITPDGVLFDPDLSNEVVNEMGSSEFQVMDSIMSVVSITVYHEAQEDLKNEVKNEKNLNLSDENKSEKNNENIKTSNSTLESSSQSTNQSTDQSTNQPTDQSNPEILLTPTKSNLKNEEIIKKETSFQPSIQNSSPSPSNKSTKITSTSTLPSPSSSSSSSSSSNKVFLKIKLHKNFEAIKNFRLEPNIKVKNKLYYWFILDLNKGIDHIYAFFKKWSPSLLNGKDSDEIYFTELESDSPVAQLLDQSQGEFEEEGEGLVKKRNLRKDWQMLSLKEHRRLVAVAEIKKLPLPEMDASSCILQDSHVAMLACNLPALAEGLPWKLAYSSEEHGFSLNTLYRKMVKSESIFFIVVKDTNESIFGALIVGQLKLSDHFEGSGESYLFTFFPEFKRFNWTGVNNFFIKGNQDSLVLGASEGNNGLWFDSELNHGRTQPCQTFDNELLTSNEDFVLQAIEVWLIK